MLSSETYLKIQRHYKLVRLLKFCKPSTFVACNFGCVPPNPSAYAGDVNQGNAGDCDLMPYVHAGAYEAPIHPNQNHVYVDGVRHESEYVDDVIPCDDVGEHDVRLPPLKSIACI